MGRSMRRGWRSGASRIPAWTGRSRCPCRARPLSGAARSSRCACTSRSCRRDFDDRAAGTFACDGEFRFEPMNDSLAKMAEELIALAAREKLTIITAESCTSGLLATVLSEAPGAGKILHGGFVTYTKEHQAMAPGVPDDIFPSQCA